MSGARIDFMRPKEATSRWSLVLLGIGATVLCMASMAWYVTHQLRNTQELHLVQVQAAQQRAEALVATQKSLTQAQQSVLDDKRWQRASKELRVPWQRALQTVEAVARPPAFLLAARLDPDRNQLELEAVAPAFFDALTMLGQLQQQTQIDQPRLISREMPIVADSSARGDMRFLIRAGWTQP
ncbi:MAG: hypothetical protein EOP38_22345 [Rubrivivax sp.]|nr:MAG: hypothetical protein EOP38_22345 [Rubrivivax sp.]